MMGVIGGGWDFSGSMICYEDFRDGMVIGNMVILIDPAVRVGSNPVLGRVDLLLREYILWTITEK